MAQYDWVGLDKDAGGCVYKDTVLGLLDTASHRLVSIEIYANYGTVSGKQLTFF